MLPRPRSRLCRELFPRTRSTAPTSSHWRRGRTAGNSCATPSSTTTSRRSPRRSRSWKRSISPRFARPAWKRRARSNEVLMSWKKIYAVIRREYVERVRTKAFWIGTLLVPIFFLGYIAIQVASFKKTGGVRTIAVVDVTGHLFGPLQKDLVAREADLKTQARRGQGLHWILEQRP